MTVQQTNNLMRPLLNITPIGNEVKGIAMHSCVFGNKGFDNKKYWPGIVRT